MSGFADMILQQKEILAAQKQYINDHEEKLNQQLKQYYTKLNPKKSGHILTLRNRIAILLGRKNKKIALAARKQKMLMKALIKETKTMIKESENILRSI
jgi:hypothetical protein